MIREIRRRELGGLLELYTHLHDNPLPPDSAALRRLWREIMRDRTQHIIVAEEQGELVSSCVLVIVPNLTHGQRPYGLIENVITRPDMRGRRLASGCLAFAEGLARAAGCYKLMLLTGSKKPETLAFYERAGYNREDKTGFIHWLD